MVRLYEIIEGLQRNLGTRCLRDCHGRMPWPSRGIYFFFEAGEVRSDSGSGQRIVRVGTHALTTKSRTSLWARLSQHRGVVKSGAGNHRGSIFRLLVGEALLRRDGKQLETWGRCDSAGALTATLNLVPGSVREKEHAAELAVSSIIGAMPFVWVRVDDLPSAASLRGVIERNAIALLSNLGKEPIDSASPSWLGLHSSRERVRRSGLWNNNHVEAVYEPAFLDVLAKAASETAAL